MNLVPYNFLKQVHHMLFRSWIPSVSPNYLDVLSNYVKTVSLIRFVQIGSNNGKTGDPLFDLMVNNKVKELFN